MIAYFRQLRNFFVSLQLTVVLLIMSLLLVFVATLDQVNLGIWAVQEKYFRSFLVFWQPHGSEMSFPIFPGGYLIGGALLINLLGAHIYRFRLTWRKLGIQLAHAGLIVLLLGELASGLLQKDSSMKLEEGETKKYSESFREFELALLDKTDGAFDDVVAIPEAVLAGKASIQHPKLPFRVTIKDYYANASLQMRDQAPAAGTAPVIAGVGARILMQAQPLTYKPEELNTPGAFVELAGPDGALGTWLVSPLLTAPQTFGYQGHTWEITLRLKRYYRPFSLTLLKVNHDVYPGTDIPKNFSSRVRLRSDDGRDDREVLIFMNNPLRYGGATFYQYQMNAASHLSVLEVVRNPGWLLPYIACAMMAVGLIIQFSFTLVGFFTKRSAAAARAPAPKATSRLPLIVLALGALYLLSTLRPAANPSAFDLTALGRLPVLSGGRIKPLDTVARTSLLTLKSKQSLTTPDGRAVVPIEWLADVLFAPEKADTYRHFRIDHQEVLDLLGLTAEEGDLKKYFSYNQLRPKLDDLDRQARLADGVEEPLRSPFQKQLLNTRDHVVLYMQLKTSVQVPESPDFATELEQFGKMLPAGINAVLAKQKGQAHDEELVKAMKEMADRFTYIEQLGNLRLVPPDVGDNDPTHWRTAGAALMEAFGGNGVNATVVEFARLGHAWRAGDSADFNQTLTTMRTRDSTRFVKEMGKSDVEARFNAADPFYNSMVLYVLALILALVSWLKWPHQLGRAAFWVVVLGFTAATAGILTRMWLEGRPPVTNLYSSALFVGWGAVLLCLALERTFRNGIGSVAAGMIGFSTLLIARYLALGGDTMEMMRAVLDSNFWLATHVVVVTAGYAATFLAGFLGLIYIVRGFFTESLDQPTADSLTRMVYGIVCFATLFSLVGTVLGGIWADQSWGRFWGWDPKENGALIIVIWNATILHARWGGLVRARGLMVMAVFGNIVTSWSWFGVNMLGIGLHSYGFMESAFYWLIAFVASQLLVMAIALMPLAKWRSLRTQAA